MKTLNTIQDLKDLVNNNNYYFNGNEFSNPSYLLESAEEHFKIFNAEGSS